MNLLLLLAFAGLVGGTPVEDASELRERLTPSTRASVIRMGNETCLWRRYELQMKLLEEDLIWLSRGYSDRQILVVQVIVLGQTIRRAICPFMFALRGAEQTATQSTVMERWKFLNVETMFLLIATRL